MADESGDSTPFTVVLTGAGGSGKSCITIRYIHGHFVSKYDPTVEDTYMHNVRLNEKNYILDIIDTAGQEEFKALRDMYMKRGDGFIIVYSITAPESFNAVSEHHETIMRMTSTRMVMCPIVLVGNKKDKEKERKVAVETGQGVKDSLEGMVCFTETSAKSGEGVNEVFETLLKYMIAARKKESEAKGSDGTGKKKGGEGGKKRRGCVLY